MGINASGLTSRPARVFRNTAIGLCVLALCFALTSCGGSTPKRAQTKPSAPEAKAALAVVNSWAVDNLTHQEPMQVPGISTTTRDTLFIAFIASDSGQGPERDGPPLDGKVQSVEGGGLQWTRQVEAHLSITGAPSIAEIWTAYSTKPVPAFTLVVTRDNTNGAVTYCDNYSGGSGPDIANGMVFVQAITGADAKNPIGATAIAGSGSRSGKVVPPSVTVTTTTPGSLVDAVGADWSNPRPRTVPAGQAMLHEDVSSPNGDSYWVQGLASPATQPGPVTLSATAPPEDNCNMAAVAINPAK